MIIHLQFGVSAPPLRNQIKDQGAQIDRREASRFQRIADALCLLKIQSIMPESAVHKARQKLLMRILKSCKAKP